MTLPGWGGSVFPMQMFQGVCVGFPALRAGVRSAFFLEVPNDRQPGFEAAVPARGNGAAGTPSPRADPSTDLSGRRAPAGMGRALQSSLVTGMHDARRRHGAAGSDRKLPG